jgi:glutathione peroxidase
MAENVLDVKVQTADGKEKGLSEYKGKVLLIVNVASKCGNTPQYAGLEKLYETYKDQGLEILGFPCNQFGGQEPGTMAEIQQFCQVNYGVKFPLFSKIEVNGAQRAPLYDKLTRTEPVGDISWNFEKFLVAKNGDVISRFTPKTKPEDPKVVGAIEQALSAKQ